MGPTTAEDDWDKSERKRKKSRLKKKKMQDNPFNSQVIDG